MRFSGLYLFKNSWVLKGINALDRNNRSQFLETSHDPLGKITIKGIISALANHATTGRLLSNFEIGGSQFVTKILDFIRMGNEAAVIDWRELLWEVFSNTAKIPLAASIEIVAVNQGQHQMVSLLFSLPPNLLPMLVCKQFVFCEKSPQNKKRTAKRKAARPAIFSLLIDIPVRGEQGK